MKTCKRILALVLALIVLLPIIPVQAAEAGQPASIEEQIRAYARSINQSNADDSAAVDLAVHGMRGGGRKLTMDASDPLTATLLNSELVQEGMAVIFADIIETMQRLDMQSVPGVDMEWGWYGDGSFYGAYILTEGTENPDNLDWLVTKEEHTGSLNSYDAALDWMVAGCAASTDIECIGNSGSTKTYRVTVTFHDRFDFSTASSSGFKNLISAFGMLLFKEFSWSCTVTMEITVPYSYDHCSHSTGAYHWVYDAENHAMISDGSGVYTQNDTTHCSQTASNGKVNHFYELDKTIRLFHNKPWVLEYDVRTPGKIIFAPVSSAVTQTHPQITQSARNYIFAVSKDYVMAPTSSGSTDRFYAFNYYGTRLQELFPFGYDTTYTFRLENEVSPDGSNRIYLTATETETGERCLDRVPMDDHYYFGGWMDSTTQVSEESSWLSGKDIHINYFGTESNGFDAKAFELRIWENGESGGTVSAITETGSPATCTDDGWRSQVCTLCGIEYREELPAPGHDYAVTETVAASCGVSGYTTYTCTVCGDSCQGDLIDALPHSYCHGVTRTPTAAAAGTLEVFCIYCGDNGSIPLPALNEADYTYAVIQEPTADQPGMAQYTWKNETYGPVTIDIPLKKLALPGDVDGSGETDVNDAIYLLFHTIFGEAIYPLAQNPDIDRSGAVDSDDALYLLYYTLFGESLYPLN